MQNELKMISNGKSVFNNNFTILKRKYFWNSGVKISDLHFNQCFQCIIVTDQQSKQNGFNFQTHVQDKIMNGSNQIASNAIIFSLSFIRLKATKRKI